MTKRLSARLAAAERAAESVMASRRTGETAVSMDEFRLKLEAFLADMQAVYWEGLPPEPHPDLPPDPDYEPVDELDGFLHGRREVLWEAYCALEMDADSHSVPPVISPGQGLAGRDRQGPGRTDRRR